MSKNDEENENKVIEDSNDIDKASNDFDSGLNEINQLSIIKDQAVKAVEDGDGFSEREAKMADVSLEHIYRRLHYKKPVSRPSLEDYKSENSKLETTKRLVVSLEADVKSLWEKFKAYCIKIWDMIIDALVSLFSNIDKSKEWAKKLYKEINTIKDKNINVKTINNSAISRTFFSSNFNIKAENVIFLLNFQKEESESIIKNLGELLWNIFKITESTFSEYKIIRRTEYGKDDNKGDDIANEYKKKVNVSIDESLSNISSIKRNGDEFKIGPFINNRYIVFNRGLEGKLKSGWEEFKKLPDLKEEKDIPVLSINEMEDICSSVIELLDSTKETKSIIDKFGKDIKVMNSELDNLTVKSAGNWLLPSNTTVNEMQSYISHVINAMYKMAHSMPTLNLLASNKALTYVELSIERYN